MTQYEQIKEKMKAENLSGAAAAKALGINPKNYYNWKAKEKYLEKKYLAKVRKKPKVITIKSDDVELMPGKNTDRIAVAFLPKEDVLAWLRGE